MRGAETVCDWLDSLVADAHGRCSRPGGTGPELTRAGGIALDPSPPPLYEGRHVIIRPAVPDDASTLYGWLQDPSFAAYKPYVSQFGSSASLLADRIAMQRLIDPPVEIEVIVLQRPTATPIGAMCLSGIDSFNMKAELSFGFIRGRGTRGLVEAITFALERAFSALKLHKLIFYVGRDNVKILNMMRRYGAVPEGYLREELLGDDQKRVDMYRFALFRRDWEESAARSRLNRVVRVK